MKTKIIANTPSNNTKTETRADSNKKIAMLTEKLANHFKIRLSSLISEKNYKFSNMILDIGSFVRKLENSNYDTESVIPRLEKYLLEILAKMPSESTKHLTDMNKINQILKTDFNSNSNNNVVNNNKIIKANKSAILITSNDKNNNNDYYTKTSPNENNKTNIINKPGAHIAVSSSYAAKSEIAKNKIISKTSSKKNIINLNNKGHNNNNNTKNILNNSNKNDKLNNLVTENKNIRLNTNANNNVIPTIVSTENTNEYQVYNTHGGRSNSTKLTLVSNNNNGNVNVVQKTDKLNDLKEKALDEWAMIVKYNHLKHLEEEQNKRNNEELKKKRVKEILENQMKEKDELKRLKQEEDKRFFRMQTENIENMERDHLEKERMRIEKVKMQKETQEKLIKGD